ncbi:TatD family hydrolase [Nigerium massiliense]|uniref:TatD family hydrolase n=1 Tax=Nigerium massiliense TaxID=1522317 RepID=UPI00058D20F1|nr:TatD family hydrolase [Nigerium massiliense]
MKQRPGAPEALPRPVTDAHTHLDSVAEGEDGLSADESVWRAAAVGVTRLVDVGVDVESSAGAIAHAERFDGVVAAVALHPNDAARLGDRLPAELARLEALIDHPRVRGVGETGLDYYRTTEPAAQRLQKEAFAAHIAWAKAYDKALVIHDRDAHDDIADVLDAEGWPDRVQFHCFSADATFARRCLDAGAWLSFPGTVTFKPNEALREALRITPSDRLLVETDAPYLTPVPFRGAPNASYLVPVTARFLAEQRGDDLAALCDALHANATAVFGDWGEGRDDRG